MKRNLHKNYPIKRNCLLVHLFVKINSYYYASLYHSIETHFHLSFCRKILPVDSYSCGGDAKDKEGMLH